MANGFKQLGLQPRDSTSTVQVYYNHIFNKLLKNVPKTALGLLFTAQVV